MALRQLDRRRTLERAILVWDYVVIADLGKSGWFRSVTVEPSVEEIPEAMIAQVSELRKRVKSWLGSGKEFRSRERLCRVEGREGSRENEGSLQQL